MSPELRRKCGDIDDPTAITTLASDSNPAAAPQPIQNKTGGQPLSAEAYPCYYKANSQDIAGYNNVTDPTCTFCEEVCQPPNVDDNINFFDGFDKTTVFIIYGILIGFSLLY